MPGPKVGSVLTPGDLRQGLMPKRQPGSPRLRLDASVWRGSSEEGSVHRGLCVEGTLLGGAKWGRRHAKPRPITACRSGLGALGTRVAANQV